jgi:hypothetical protein
MMTLAQVDAAIDKNENFLKGLRRQYKSQLPNFMARLVDWLKANRDRNTRLLRQSLSDIDILRLFNAGGVAQLVNVEELLARSIESAATLLPETDTFGVLRLSRSAVKQTLDGVVLEVGLQVSQTVEKVQSLVADMVVTPISVKEATARLTTESNLLKSKAQTVVNTALGQAQRKLHTEAAEAIPSNERLRWYVGPKDSANRGFCGAIVRKALTDEQISKLDNRQGVSALTGGGGYNCRHHWVPISREYADIRGIPLATAADINRANAAAARS